MEKERRSRGRGRGKGKGRGKGSKGQAEDRERAGVGFVVSPAYWKKVKDFEQINGRLCVLTLHAKHQPIAIVNTYCPASTQTTEVKEKHYQGLNSLSARFTSSHVTYI